MNVAPEPALLQGVRAALLDLDPCETPGDWLRALVQRGFGQLPLPGTGRTL